MSDLNTIKKTFDGKTAKLIDLCLSITDCHHSTPSWTDSGKIVIRNFNIKNGKLLLENISYTDDENFNERISRSKPEPGDLIITREAPMGEVCIIPEGLECCLGQRLVLIKPDPQKIDGKYLLYALLSEHVQIQINKSNNTGSIVSNLRIPDLQNLVIPINNYSEKIAAVLSALDAKIDVNNRINAELEKLAKTIYDYWFVQFDFPNEDGKPYKASGGKMVYNDQLKRPIPAGWDVGKIKNIAKNIRNTIQGSDLKNNLDYIGLEHIPRKSIVLDSWDSQSDLSSTKSVFCRGNILFGKLRPYFHKVGVAFIDGICSTEILVIDSTSKPSFCFLLMTLSSDRFIEYVSSAMEGTRMPRTKWSFMENFSLVIPPNHLLQKFNDLIQPSLKKMGKNVHENQELTQLRDWLLPLLMNGQVRVE